MARFQEAGRENAPAEPTLDPVLTPSQSTETLSLLVPQECFWLFFDINLRSTKPKN